MYVLKHTKAMIYLTILSLEKIVTLWQTSPSLTSFWITGCFTEMYIFGLQGVLLKCICPHPVRKHIAVRALWGIKDDALVEDHDKFIVLIKGVLMWI